MMDLIIARNLDKTIAIDGVMPWYCPTDLQRFVKITKQYDYVVMGRKTWEDLPDKPKNRLNKMVIVVTKEPEKYKNKDTEGVFYCCLETVKEIAQEHKCICIGGAKLAEALMAYIDTVFLTTIHASNPDNINKLEVTKFEYNFFKFFRLKEGMIIPRGINEHQSHEFSIWER